MEYRRRLEVPTMSLLSQLEDNGSEIFASQTEWLLGVSTPADFRYSALGRLSHPYRTYPSYRGQCAVGRSINRRRTLPPWCCARRHRSTARPWYPRLSLGSCPPYPSRSMMLSSAWCARWGMADFF